MPRINSDITAAIGRLLMSLIFIQAGWGKLMAGSGAIAYIASQGIPVPPAAYAVTVFIELGCGLAILLGWQTRLAAVFVALFCVATGFMVHYQPDNAGQMIHFMKNICMAGGFLTVAAHGAGAFSLDARLPGRKLLAVA